MQEVFFTILVIWILFRIFNSGSFGSKRNVNFTQNNYNQKESPKEGETKITYTPKNKTGKPPRDEDYVDFEEIK